MYIYIYIYIYIYVDIYVLINQLNGVLWITRGVNLNWKDQQFWFKPSSAYFSRLVQRRLFDWQLSWTR